MNTSPRRTLEKLNFIEAQLKVANSALFIAIKNKEAAEDEARLSQIRCVKLERQLMELRREEKD